MKKALIIIVAVLVVGIVLMGMFAQDARKSNDNAQKDKEGRYLTIINDTNQIINEVHITVGEGTEIEDMRQTDPDETSFSIEIPKEYSDYTTFVVTLVDRYGMKYQKEVIDVSAKGRTEVTVKETDYIKEKGDFWNKLDKLFNGD